MNIKTQPSKKIHLALVTETFSPEINGVAMTLGKLVDYLLNNQHKIQIIRPKQSKKDTARNEVNLEEHLMSGMRIPHYPELKLGFPAQRKLMTLWQRNRPDIIHIATEGPLGWSALKVAKKLNIPTVSSFHTNFHQYSSVYGLGFLSTLIKNYLKHFHNQTLITLAPTEKLSVSLSKIGYDNVGVMKRGIDTDQFNPSKRCHILRQEWGASKNDLVVIYIGRLAKEKNINLVLRTFEQIKIKQPQAKLVFVGNGPMQKDIELRCPYAVFSGNKQGELLAKHYASGDLFLFPSMTETYGNVIPEALASGLAVVAFKAAAAAELITHKKNGELINYGDEESFISSAQTLAQDQAQIELYKQMAYEKIKQRSWQSVGNSLEHHLFRFSAPKSLAKNSFRSDTLHKRACT